LKLSVIMPVYNERQTIREILTRVREVETIPKEIIVIDDGSTDGTQDLLREEDGRDGVQVIFQPYNQGKGAAIRRGLQVASGDIILIQDADLEYDPRDYGELIRPILEERAEVVYGSRFLGGPRRAMLFWHAVANHLLTLFTNILYDTILSDMETCYKVFKADVIQQIPLHAQRFEFEPEVTAKVLRRGIRIYEVPISYTGREYYEGKKIRFHDALIALWTLIRYRFTD